MLSQDSQIIFQMYNKCRVFYTSNLNIDWYPNSLGKNQLKINNKHTSYYVQLKLDVVTYIKITKYYT